MALNVDDDAFPMLWYAFLGELSVEDADRFAEHNRRALERARDEGVQLFMLIDCLQAGKAGAETRHRFGTYTKEVFEPMRAHCGGTAVLISNAILRGAMTAVQWVAPEAMSGTRVAKDLEHGLEQLRAMAEEAGAPLSAADTDALIARHYPDAA
jgi:hypothetical protein